MSFSTTEQRVILMLFRYQKVNDRLFIRKFLTRSDFNGINGSLFYDTMERLEKKQLVYSQIDKLKGRGWRLTGRLGEPKGDGFNFGQFLDEQEKLL